MTNSPEQTEPALATQALDIDFNAPPYVGVWTEIEITSERELISILVDSSHEAKWAYRGQARKEWRELWPLFWRKLRLPNDQTPPPYSHLRMLEQRTITRFLQRAVHLVEPADLPLLDDLFQRYVVMQHFRAPTRLIDWSRSPWVALYFAVSSEPEHDGTIWRLDWEELQMRTGRDQHEWWQTTKELPLPHAIPHFFGELDPPTIWPLVPVRANDRIAAQQSVFTIGSRLDRSHDELLRRTIFGPGGTNALTKFNIAKDLKTRLVRMLARMNVSAATLFPGIDGLGMSICELLAANEPGPNLIHNVFASDGKRRLFSFVPPNTICH